jgi:hypothetical protein
MEDSNLIALLFSSPFANGLASAGLLSVIYIRGFLRRRELAKEVDRLRSHLHTKLEIDSADNERRKNELNNLRQERDNLRITVQSLNQKPGRKEIRQYFIYQTALDIMFEKAPGFAPAWQITPRKRKVFSEIEGGAPAQTTDADNSRHRRKNTKNKQVDDR